MSWSIVAVIIGVVLCAVCIDRLARWKHRSPQGWVISTLFLGPLPLLLILLLPSKRVDDEALGEGNSGKR